MGPSANGCFLTHAIMLREDKLVRQAARCSRFDAVYNCDATIKLLRLFLKYPTVKLVYLNCDKVQQACGPGRARFLIDHDDHLHVEIRACL